MTRLALISAEAILAHAAALTSAQSVDSTGTTAIDPGDARVSSSGQNETITAAGCTIDRLGTSVPTSAIGEPVRGVTLSAPSWVDAGNGAPAHCRVNGSMVSIDTSSTARPINFSVALPAAWSRRAAQLGGGGMNGFVPNLTGGGPGASGPSLLDRGFAT